MINNLDLNACFKKNSVVCQKIQSGYTNNNYLSNDGYVIKKYNNLFLNNEALISPLVKNFDVPLIIINSKVKITKFINGKTLEQEKMTTSKVIKIAHLIKKLHCHKIKQKIKIQPYFSPQLIVENFKKQIKKPLYNYKKYDYLVQKAQKIFSQAKKTLCHNDLTPGNFLFTKTKTYLIDWEFAGINDPLFDIASFLNENNLFTTKLEKVFLKSYFQDYIFPWKKILFWKKFQDLMWLFWANAMYDFNGEKCYLEMAKNKKTSLKNYFE